MQKIALDKYMYYLQHGLLKLEWLPEKHDIKDVFA